MRFVSSMLFLSLGLVIGTAISGAEGRQDTRTDPLAGTTTGTAHGSTATSAASDSPGPLVPTGTSDLLFTKPLNACHASGLACDPDSGQASRI